MSNLVAVDPFWPTVVCLATSLVLKYTGNHWLHRGWYGDVQLLKLVATMKCCCHWQEGQYDNLSSIFVIFLPTADYSAHQQLTVSKNCICHFLSVYSKINWLHQMFYAFLLVWSDQIFMSPVWKKQVRLLFIKLWFTLQKNKQ